MTGTKENRDEFQMLLSDCKSGKVDMIITKSISRFARNMVTLLKEVRQLKLIGIEVWFVEENIWTFDGKGELLITIMSSFAQEESRSISENVTWGKRKRMADVHVTICYGNFLGYEKGENGQPKIVECEAEVVQRIYKMYLNGRSAHSIAQSLTRQGIPTPKGMKNWDARTVFSILTN